MQHFRCLQKRALFLTLRGQQNIPTCKYYTKNVRFSLQDIPTRQNSLLPHKHLYLSETTRCGFHTTQRRNVHPVIWIILKPILKISAALTGRGVRKWYRGMGKEERGHFIRRVKERWYLFAGALGAVISGFVVYYLSHIQETPITGRKRFMALTHDQIISIAQAQADSVVTQYQDNMYSMESVQAKRVMDVAKRLLKSNPELQKMVFDKWQVYVVKDPLVNACVLPSGHVFVFDGMLEVVQTQDELAIILGHEMAHALLEHGIEELSYSQFIDYIVILIMAALWCVIPHDGIALVTNWFHHKLVKILTNLPHSRALEQEADKVGAMLAAKACFDIRQGVVLWQKMEAAEKMITTESLPTFLSTHPHNLKRAEFFDFIIPQAEKWRDEMQCPLWPRRDPRQTIEIISKIADNHIAAKKTGQNLRRVQLADSVPVAKAVAGIDFTMSKSQTADISMDEGICIQQAENVQGTKRTNNENVSIVTGKDDKTQRVGQSKMSLTATDKS